jgi:hypothetical protein
MYLCISRDGMFEKEIYLGSEGMIKPNMFGFTTHPPDLQECLFHNRIYINKLYIYIVVCMYVCMYVWWKNE